MTALANPTPKSRFIESSQNISSHRKLVDDPAFQRSLDYAMLEFANTLARTSIEPQDISLGAAGLKLRGAQEFLHIFRNLSEQPKDLPKIARLDNLNHAV